MLEICAEEQGLADKVKRGLEEKISFSILIRDELLKKPARELSKTYSKYIYAKNHHNVLKIIYGKFLFFFSCMSAPKKNYFYIQSFVMLAGLFADYQIIFIDNEETFSIIFRLENNSSRVQ